MTTPLFPHLDYAQDVHTALVDAGLRPHAFQVLTTAPAHAGGPDSGPELEIHASWTSRHRFVTARHLPHGFRLIWKHTTGWSVTPLLLRDLQQLPVPLAADPQFIAEMSCDLGMNGLPIAIDGTTVTEWSHAATLHENLLLWQTGQMATF